MNDKEIVAYYEQTQSIRAAARKFSISEQTVRKALISNGAYTSDTADMIARLAQEGYETHQICERTKLSKSTVLAYLPYAKGSYVLGDKSLNARRIAACRKRRASN